MSSTNNKTCLRCVNEELKLLDCSDEQIQFYECPKCFSNFTQKKGKDLTDRWLSSISLVLYCIIFEEEPQNAYQRVGDYFFENSENEIVTFINDIEIELKKPTQKVSEIHDLVYEPKENDVREFLQMVVSYWKEKLNA
jgi:transposase-like protein